MAPASLTAAQTRPEPMNVTQNHPKVKVSITLPKNHIFVAGEHVSGRMEMECRAEGGELGIGRVRIELFAIQELTSRDHSAHSLFLHSTRIFQGPGLPPSNAVHAYPQPGDPPLPANYYPARRGIATFLFRFPIPKTAPGSINFGAGVAKVKYELRASVGVIWKDDKREVVFIREVGLVESWNPPPNLFTDPLMDLQLQANQEGVVVGEGGKIWARASIVGGFLVAGEPGCIELMVKNHSNKKNSGLIVTLSRILILPAVENSPQHKAKEHRIHISDTLLTVPFRGSEYVIPSGAEGVASLVFDVPETAKGVRGGTISVSDEAEDLGEDTSMAVARGRRERDWRKEERKESLFEVRCILGVKIDMGIGSKDIQAELTAPVFHPVVVPDDIDFNPMIEPYPYAMDHQVQHVNHSPGPMSPPIPAPYPFQPNMPVPYPVQSPVPGQYYQPQPVYNNLPPAPLPGVVQSGSPVAYLDEANNRLWLSPLPHSAQSPMPGQHLMDNGMFIVPHRSLSASPGAIPVSPGLDSFQNQYQEQPFAVPLSPGYGYPDFSSNVHNFNASPGSDSGTGLDAEEGKGQRSARVAAHLRMSSRHRSVSPTPHRFPMGAPNTGADIDPSGSNAAGILSTSQNVTSLSPRGQTGGMKKARTLPQLPMPPPPPVLPDGSLEPEAEVLSPRPLLSPRTSYTDLRSPKSDSVKTLEKLAEEVDRTNGDLSGDSGLAAVANASPVEEKNIEMDFNKTLPKPPPATITLTSATPEDVSQVHAAALPDSGPPTKAHPTPRAAITPMRLDYLFTPKVSAAVPAESNLLKSLTSQRKLRGLAPDVPPLPSQSSPDGPAESGLDALERRLLADVGTRKVDIKRAPDVRDILAGFSTSPPGPSGALSDTGSQPVAIPRTKCIGAYDEPPVNDSCISSFTLAGERERDEWERELEERERERERNAMAQAMVERELQYEREAARKLESLEVPGEDCDADVDSDDRTHRGKRSHISAHSGSGESRRTKRSSDGKKKHKSRGGKSRKSDGDGEGSSSEGRRKSGRKKDKAQNGESHANRTKKKTEAAKGRVAAWLGTIQPEIPPEEDVVVASPVVEVHNNPVLGFEDPSTAEWSKDAGEPQDVPTLPTQDEDVSALPNPRSSGFVPIGTLKNEWNTFQLRRARFDGGNSAKIPVDGETMRIRNIWTSVGASPPSQSPPKSQKSPILLPTAARPILKNGASPTKPTVSPRSHAFQSIRTDRRVSPPSSTAVLDILGATHFAKPSIPSPTSPPREPTLSPSAPEESPIAVPKQSPRVPAFPPLSKTLQDPEVKYDVRSARGGRGGQVSAMASLWASGTGNQPEPKPGHLEVRKHVARLSSPTDHGKVMPTSPVSTPASSPVISTQPKELQKKNSAEAIPVTQKTPAPIKVSVGGITVGKSSAPRLATVPEVASTKPAIKATSVPAVISSSLAIPTLSSTASLVRPVQKVRSSLPLQPSVTMLPAINEQKAGDRERFREPRHSVAVASPTKSLPSTDLGFGKARLRELIKKYQGQAA